MQVEKAFNTDYNTTYGKKYKFGAKWRTQYDASAASAKTRRKVTAVG